MQNNNLEMFNGSVSTLARLDNIFKLCTQAKVEKNHDVWADLLNDLLNEIVSCVPLEESYCIKMQNKINNVLEIYHKRGLEAFKKNMMMSGELTTIERELRILARDKGLTMVGGGILK